MAVVHHRTCNLCEAMCGLTLTVEKDRIVDLRGDPEDVLSQGHVCPKAKGLQDLHEDPDRLRQPLRREGAQWSPVDWDEAFDDIATRIRAIQDKYGRPAFGTYQGNPTVHNLGTMIFAQLLTKRLKTPNHYSATSLDQLPHMLASYTMFGDQLLLPVPDLDRTSFLVMMGANPLVSNGSLMSAGNVRARLDALSARGGRLVVIDPRRTETSKRADQHLFIRPGTDALLLAAVAQCLISDVALSPRLEPFLRGQDQLPALLEPFTPEAVTGPTGVSTRAIRKLAKDFARAPSAAWYGRVGVCTQEFGGLSAWLINVINILAGHFDRPGGMMFASPAIDVSGVAERLGRLGSFRRRFTRVRKLPEFGGEFPTAALAEEIETPGDGQIRGLLVSCGNPVLSSPDGRRLDKALASLEFMVAVDPYLNETTRHAHYILPPTSALERSHYDLVFHALAVRNTTKYSPPLFERPPEARHDWEIYIELASRLGPRTLAHRAQRRVERTTLLRLGPEGLLDVALRSGPYGDRFVPAGGLNLKALKAAPHGIDLGPLKPRLPERLRTKDRQIDLVPDIYKEDFDRLKARLTASVPKGTLCLIGRRELRSNNSWMHNSQRLTKGKERCTLRIHPDDAQPRAIVDGQPVTIRSAVGEVIAPAEVTNEMMPGVVSLPHGWGHHRRGTRLKVATSRPGVSINDITDPQLVDRLSGNAQLSDVPVTVKPLGASTHVESNPRSE